MHNSVLLKIAALLVFVCAAKTAAAQTTIFNVPTTDVVAKGKVYFELDYLPQIPKPDKSDRIHIIDPRLVVGPGANIEDGVNVAYVHTAGTTHAVLQLDAKW